MCSKAADLHLCILYMPKAGNLLSEHIKFINIVLNSFMMHFPLLGPPRGFGDLGRRAIYFQGAGEHC